jgi:interferon gamma-inducible protein 30
MARDLRLFFVLLVISAAGLVPPPAAAAGPAKVPLALYYESLCPYCSRFIVNHLAGIFDDGLIDIVDLLLVPYGNAHVRGENNTINCQVISVIRFQFPFHRESSSSLSLPSSTDRIALPRITYSLAFVIDPPPAKSKS